MYAKGHWQHELDTGVTVWFFSGESYFTLTSGWRYNRKNYLGVGTRYQKVEINYDGDPEANNGAVPFIPLYIAYQHYTPFYHFSKQSFLFEIHGGVGYYPGKTLSIIDTERWDHFIRCKYGLDFQIYKNIGLQLCFDGLFATFGGAGLSAGVRF